jgi:pimeloyl-ACP methyl ester carboxylesterase
MAVESESFTELTDEFALVAETAAEVGVAADALPRVRRSWVNVPAVGHVSGVWWGEGPPELVFLHDIGDSARRWDAVALAAGRPAVAIDLPGHGRSDWRRDGQYEPAKLAPAVAEAIRSFAPRVALVVGVGLGADTALALRRRHARLVPGLALVGTLPGASSGRSGQRPGPERFASHADALAALAARRPDAGHPALRREVLYELVQQPGGFWTWRHHGGNQPPAPAPGEAGSPDGDALWDELGQLGRAAVVIRGDQAGGLTASDLARLGERVPDAVVLMVPGAGADFTAKPAALAAALVRLLMRPSAGGLPAARLVTTEPKGQQ